MAEITAIGIYMEYWFPSVPRWVWALAALIIMGAVNFLAVKAYGELEFWFALIKIITIIAMIAVGAGMIFFGFGNGGIATGIHHLWEHGGFFPNGIKGVFLSLQMVMFAYLGIEMIGVTAGEVKNPQKLLLEPLIQYFGAFFYSMWGHCLSLCLFILGRKLAPKEVPLSLPLKKLAFQEQLVLLTL